MYSREPAGTRHPRELPATATPQGARLPARVHSLCVTVSGAVGRGGCGADACRCANLRWWEVLFAGGANPGAERTGHALTIPHGSVRRPFIIELASVPRSSPRRATSLSGAGSRATPAPLTPPPLGRRPWATTESERVSSDHEGNNPDGGGLTGYPRHAESPKTAPRLRRATAQRRVGLVL
jgi:hypothetical protein